jgi:predicted permease
MSQLLLDFRIAVRRLRQQPVFALVAVLTLAIGLGANTAVFTLIHAVMLRSLPVQRPEELYRLGDGDDCCVNFGLATRYSLFSFRLFDYLRANTPEFSELAAFQANTIPLGLRRSGESVPASVPGEFVTANYFDLFGVKPAAGRLFQPGDDRPGAAPVAVMSYRGWSQYYSQDPAVIGGAFVINGKPMTIVGVAGAPFFGDTIRPDPPAVWIPVGQEPSMLGDGSLYERPGQNWLYAIGRIKPGAKPAQIEAHVTAVLQQWLSGLRYLSARERTEIPKQHIVVTPATGGVALARLQYERSLNLLSGASAMVLLIGIANLANLLLSRADRGQAAVRAALGASSGRLIQGALAEGLVLAVGGGLIGLGIGAISTRALINIAFPTAAFVPVDVTPSAAVIGFVLVLTIAAGVLSTAAPAWAMARTPPLEALTGVGRTGGPKSFVPRGSLIVLQVALSGVLLVTTGLLASSLANLETQRLGFLPANRYVVRIEPAVSASNVDRLAVSYAQFEESLRRVPGVERAASALYGPMEGDNWSNGITIGGRHADLQNDNASWNRVSAGYFETIGTRVLRGRSINEHDTPRGKHVAVVNDAFVRKFFVAEEPIGQTVGLGEANHSGDFEIVGVVEDVKYTGAAQHEVRPMLFLPAFQTVEFTSPAMRLVQGRSTILHDLIVQVAPTARDVEAGIRRALASVDSNVNVIRVQPMTVQVSQNFRLERLTAGLTSIYSVLALALAALGLYGVAAYSVSQRTREIGVRMALGANRWRILRLCMRAPLLQTSVGLGIGLLAGLAAGRALSAQLYEIGTFEPRVFAVAAVVLLGSATIAAGVPALRALSLAPASALRDE